MDRFMLIDESKVVLNFMNFNEIVFLYSISLKYQRKKLHSIKQKISKNIIPTEIETSFDFESLYYLF